MKTRLNLSIDQALVEEMKAYAFRKQTSISDLVEQFFRSATQSKTRKTIIDLVEELEAPPIAPSADLKEMYYSEQAGKYGF